MGIEHIPFRLDRAITVDRVDGMSPEQFRKWKIEKKSIYSKPHDFRAIEELQSYFPNGWMTENGFVVDKVDSQRNPIRSFFNECGLETERAYYKPGTPLIKNPPDESFHKRVTSQYDENGFLVHVISMRSSGRFPGGFVRKIEYEILNHRGEDIKVPSRMVTQEVLPHYPADPSLRKPGWHISYRPPEIIDFTDVPFVPPKQ